MEEQVITVKEIKEDFDKESERLLQSYKDFLNNEPDLYTEKIRLLEKNGFSSHPDVIAAKEREDVRKHRSAWKKIYEENKAAYPQYRFITNNTLKKILDKYGLVYAKIQHYIVDIPLKNLKELDKAKDTFPDGWDYLIAAPRDMFSKNLSLKGKYLSVVVNDPIIFKETHNGYLIITAWGDEEKVMNEKE